MQTTAKKREKIIRKARRLFIEYTDLSDRDRHSAFRAFVTEIRDFDKNKAFSSLKT